HIRSSGSIPSSVLRARRAPGRSFHILLRSHSASTLFFPHSLSARVTGLSFTARIEGAHFDRAASASKKDSRLPLPHPLCASIICPEEGVDPRLIARPLRLEPIQGVTIQAKGDGGFWLGRPQYGTLEESFS